MLILRILFGGTNIMTKMQTGLLNVDIEFSDPHIEKILIFCHAANFLYIVDNLISI